MFGSSAAIGAGEFGALMLMVLATTFVTPPLLSRVAGRAARRSPADRPGDGGIDDLVAGANVECEIPGGKRGASSV